MAVQQSTQTSLQLTDINHFIKDVGKPSCSCHLVCVLCCIIMSSQLPSTIDSVLFFVYRIAGKFGGN